METRTSSKPRARGRDSEAGGRHRIAVMESRPVDGPRDVRPRKSAGAVVLDGLRGAVIGTVEIIPGVSGGTLALVLGVYETIIASAGEFVRGVASWGIGVVRRTGSARARSHFAKVRWGVIVPILVGMAAGVVAASAIIAPLIEEYPTQSRALFAGMILMSVLVPIRMVDRWTAREVVIAVVATVFAVWVTGLTGVERADPSLWLVAGAASLAICALVLPGVSGAFLLVVLGLYAPTLAALNDRDLAYIGAFMGGAIVGLSLFVSSLEWLLEHKRAVTLAAMTGLMAGSVRALWPWQNEAGGPQSPHGSVGIVAVLFVVGILVVAVLLVLESRARRSVVAADIANPH